MIDVMMLRMVPGAPAGMSPGVRALPLKGERPGQFHGSLPSPGGRFPTALGARPSRQQPQVILRSRAVSVFPALGQANQTGFPSSSSAAWQVQSTQINLTVFEPEELRGYAGAFVSVYQVPNPAWRPSMVDAGAFSRGGAAGNPHLNDAPELAAEGETDQDGKYYVELQAPIPTGQWYYKIVIASSKEGTTLAGSRMGSWGEDFETQVLDVPATTVEAEAAGSGQPGFPAKVFPMAAVCPAGTDPLVCEVARLQVYFLQLYHLKLPEWATQPGAPGESTFAIQAAHGALDTNVFPKNPDLARGWGGNLSWAIMDLSIPPKDWPQLLRNYWQLMDIWNTIPFPVIQDIPDLFKRCAKGIPITTGKSGEPLAVNNFRLYAPGYSNYFPRADTQIRKDLAARYIMNIPAIWACMESKIQAKAKELRKKARYASALSLFATLMLAPMAGGAGMLTSIGTEIASVAMQNFGAKSIATEGITAAVAAGLITAGNSDLVVSALKPLVDAQTADLPPEVKQAVALAFPKLVGLATEQISSNLLAGGAMDFGAMSGPATAITTALVKLLAGIPKMMAAKQAKHFGNQLQGFNQALSDFQMLLSGEGVPPTWKPFLVWVIDNLGLDDLMNQVIDQFIQDVGSQVGADVGNSGTVGTMPDAGTVAPGAGEPVQVAPPQNTTPPVTSTPQPQPQPVPSTGGTAQCPPGQYWNGQQCMAMPMSVPTGTGLPSETYPGTPTTDCPGGICNVATTSPTEEPVSTGKKVAVVLTVGAAAGAAALLLMASGAFNGK